MPRITDFFSIDRMSQEPRVKRKGLRDLIGEMADETFPIPLIMDASGEIWFAYPTIHGVSRTAYPNLQGVPPEE